MADNEKSGKGNVDGQRPFIKLEEAFELYTENAILKSYINTGYFRYRTVGFFSVFSARSRETPDYLSFGEENGKNTFSNTDQNKAVLSCIEKSVKFFEAEHKRKEENAISPNEKLLDYMKQAKWNAAIFKDKTLLQGSDYTKLKDSSHRFTVRTYAAMAVGLGLSLTEFQEILRLAGFCLEDGNRQHDAYAFVLSALRGCDIDKCNDFLERVEVEKLGTQSRM